jgi:hypothetical protein
MHVCTAVVVTRSSPHANRSSPRHTTSPEFLPLHSATTGLQKPAFEPGVVSQLLPVEHVPFVAHAPPLHTSCPRCP